MLRFLVVEDKPEESATLASEVIKASEEIKQYAHIRKIKKTAIRDVTDWEGYDSIFIRVSASRIDPAEFRIFDYVRAKNAEAIMVFYSSELKTGIARRLFDYYPANYLQIPVDSYKLRETIRWAYEKNPPVRLFIEIEQGCILRDASDILCFDVERKIIYAGERIQISNKGETYQQYVVGFLKKEGFLLVKGRYWVNRFWKQKPRCASRGMRPFQTGVPQRNF